MGDSSIRINAGAGSPLPVDYTPPADTNFPFNPEAYPNVPDSISQWGNLVNINATRFNLPPRLLLGQLWQESSGNPNAVSITGAQGLMQLFPAAVDDVRNISGVPVGDWQTEPAENVKAGAAYLSLQRQRTGNIYDALRAYYQGFQPSGNYNRAADKYHDDVLNKAYRIGYLGLT